ncbi:EAL domain-containing protein [Planococcus kocurii]|uniref:sensor domain-containing protein n=1 Tax=Planococcus kocurii TaxID=1374 RepID=UPI003CFE36D6
MDYYSLSDYMLSITIASIAAFIGITVIRKVDFTRENKNKVRILSIIVGAIIYFTYLDSSFLDIGSPSSLLTGIFVFLFSSFAVYTAVLAICSKEISFQKLLLGAIIFACCISLVNFIDIRTEMVEKNLKMNILLFVSANILLLGNTIATFRFIRQLRKIEKVNISWIIYGSIAVGIAFASIRFTLFSSITLFSNIDLFNNRDIPISNWLYLNDTLLPLTINVFGLVFLELFPGFVSDFYSEKQKELINKNKHQYETLFENQAIAIFTLDASGKITKINKATQEMLGFQLKELKELSSFSELIHAQRKDEFLSLSVIAFNGESQMFETKLLTRMKTEVNVQITLVPNFLEEELTHITIFAKDISEIVEAREKIHHMAYHDPLTLLPNRRFFEEELSRRITASSPDAQMAVCFLDLDRFKLVNDILGHQAGDHLLQVLANRFTAMNKQDLVISRLGGDEFTFLFSDISSHENFEKQVEDVLSQIQTPFLLENQEFYITGSIGIALYPQDSCFGEDLMKFADAAMYSAKEKGKNMYEFYQNHLKEMNPKQLLLEADMRKAVKEKQFEIYYQPQINFATGKVFGVEALLRWNHPEEGLISPEDFIATAEENQLIIELGQWVLAESSKQVKIWQEAGHKKLHLSVNVSIKQFFHQNFIKNIEEIVKNTGYALDMLDLEITESMAIRDVEYAKDIFDKIRNLGISISMDDFGTGYSSLNHLKNFSIDRLKIDGSLVQDIATDEKARTIINTIIVMAKNLKLVSLAERVETVEQQDYLTAIGCNEVQGYLYAKPLNRNEMTKFLKENFNANLLKSSQMDYVPPNYLEVTDN